ncbi:MAG: universal stress protein [Bacteroidia bacterium]|nr:universal stress protein [Bacteroidia bacterium]
MITLNTSRILVPFDFSLTSKKALKHAAALAQICKGELQLLYIQKPKSRISIGRTTAELRRIAEEAESNKRIIEMTAKEIREEYNIPVKVLVDIGNKISGILSVCEKNKVGLIVMGTEGSDSVSNLFSGSNSHKVVSRSTIPVITVRAETKREGYANILIPVDLSEHTRQKIVMAIQLAKLFKSRLHLLGILNKEDKDAENKLKAIIKQIEKRLKSDNIEYTSELVVSDTAASKALVVAKRKKSDMIITMTDQGPSASLLGPRTFDHELVDESNIPVLSVPPELHEENIAPASIAGLW